LHRFFLINLFNDRDSREQKRPELLRPSGRT
jgi:hypothetical protein